MTIQDVDAEILGPMQVVFLPPRGMSEEQQTATLKEYSRALEHFDVEDLKTAWADVRDAHTSRGWPVIGQFVLAARVARKARVGDTPRHAVQGDSAAARWLRWTAVRASQLALEAMAKNVTWSLKCKILDGAKIEQVSVQELFFEKIHAEKVRDKIEAGEPVESTLRGIPRMIQFEGDNRVKALQMFDNLLTREEETQNEIRKHNAGAGSGALSETGARGQHESNLPF